MPLKRRHAILTHHVRSLPIPSSTYPDGRARHDTEHVRDLLAWNPRQHGAEPFKDFLLLREFERVDVVVDLHEAFQVRIPRHVLSAVIAKFLCTVKRQDLRTLGT